jgi:hypothetical protein
MEIPMRSLPVSLVVAMICAASMADVVELKNNQKINAQIVGLEDGKLLLMVQGQQQEIRMSTVRSFRIGDGAAINQTAGDNNQERLSFADSEVGKTGFIIATLTVGDTDEGRFIGTYKIMAEGLVRGERAAVLQGVDADSLVSGQFVRLNQRMKCVGTENIGGRTVYVFEPVQPDQRAVTKAEDPALSQPVSGGVRVAPIR